MPSVTGLRGVGFNVFASRLVLRAAGRIDECVFVVAVAGAAGGLQVPYPDDVQGVGAGAQGGAHCEACG